MPLPPANPSLPPHAAGVERHAAAALGLMSFIAAGFPPGGLQWTAVLAVVLLAATLQAGGAFSAAAAPLPRTGPGAGAPRGRGPAGTHRMTALDQAADLMARGCFAEALEIVDHQLAHRPATPEALVLKARILLLAHDDTYAARRYCQTAMGLTAPEAPPFQAALEVFLSISAPPRPQ